MEQRSITKKILLLFLLSLPTTTPSSHKKKINTAEHGRSQRDVSRVRVRSIPSTTLWDTVIEYDLAYSSTHSVSRAAGVLLGRRLSASCWDRPVYSVCILHHEGRDLPDFLRRHF